MSKWIEYGRILLLEKVEKDGFQPQNMVALALKKNKLIAVGFNSYSKTHPKQHRAYSRVNQTTENGITLGYPHAETIAIHNALKNRKHPDCIVIVRINRAGELVMAKPCKSCTQLIKDTKSIKSIEFSI